MIRLVDPDGLLVELIACQTCRLQTSSRGRTAPFLHNMRFAVFIACPLHWKVTRELRDYS